MVLQWDSFLIYSIAIIATNFSMREKKLLVLKQRRNLNSTKNSFKNAMIEKYF